jgi:hypothetical protein
MIFFVSPAGACFFNNANNLPPDPEEVNYLIYNGNFESGLAGWQYSNNVRAKGSWANVDPLHGSSRQAVLGDMGFSPASLSQEFSVEAGSEVSISFDYNLWAFNRFCGKTGDDFIVSLNSDYYFDEILRDTIVDKPRHKSKVSGWQHFDETFFFEEDMDLSIMFELDNFKNPMQLSMAFLDNVKIEQISAVPIPGTFLLLMSGIAGLFTIKKRFVRYK